MQAQVVIELSQACVDGHVWEAEANGCRNVGWSGVSTRKREGKRRLNRAGQPGSINRAEPRRYPDRAFV